ncbi:hypothetical protein Q765_11205 [Flavobacterium rivuli WB 3.3-2 = DSM 21788]|uniref:Addiction module protein n=1 Tax=Flavobacterium rivuli WB 3.3-2 = DSM 21788 TaxID=1121895 RepID=A0A0A2M2E0_9FLAO|nr:hypothetical protein [Flavobacterium rivuli]KGO86439.1 hypothetical protein Q765_11205 [Flavobacterium rivuli WB 3.3-2 = DSM 21788]
MDLEFSKLELIEMLLQTSKESVLSRVRAILEEEQDFVINNAFYTTLDERREEYERGEGQSFTWQEVKQNVRDAKNGI